MGFFATGWGMAKNTARGVGTGYKDVMSGYSSWAGSGAAKQFQAFGGNVHKKDFGIDSLVNYTNQTTDYGLSERAGHAAGVALGGGRLSFKAPGAAWNKGGDFMAKRREDISKTLAREGSNHASHVSNSGLKAVAVGGLIGAGSIYGAASLTGSLSGDPGHPFNAASLAVGHARGGRNRQSVTSNQHQQLMRMAEQNPAAIGQRQIDRIPGQAGGRGRGIQPGQFGDTGDLVFAMSANRRG